MVLSLRSHRILALWSDSSLRWSGWSNDFQRTTFADDADIVPTVDANTDLLNLVKRRYGMVLPTFKAALLLQNSLRLCKTLPFRRFRARIGKVSPTQLVKARRRSKGRPSGHAFVRSSSLGGGERCGSPCFSRHQTSLWLSWWTLVALHFCCFTPKTTRIAFNQCAMLRGMPPSSPTQLTVSMFRFGWVPTSNVQP